MKTRLLFYALAAALYCFAPEIHAGSCQRWLDTGMTEDEQDEYDRKEQQRLEDERLNREMQWEMENRYRREQQQRQRYNYPQHQRQSNPQHQQAPRQGSGNRPHHQSDASSEMKCKRKSAAKKVVLGG